jgi:hypothetical protein
MNQGQWQPRQNQPTAYRIQILGQLDASWSDWFEGMNIVCNGKTSTLKGPVADQAALRGILVKLWDLHLSIISVSQEMDTADQEEINVAAESRNKRSI